MERNLPTLIEAMLDPVRYPHPVDRVELIETHISWVLLAGESAYKIKKPVDLGFLDFNTLESRHAMCEEEVRLNRRLAPSLYLGVIAISGTPARPEIGGPGAAIEYAVAMRRFRRDDEFTALARLGRIEPGHVDGLARTIARFHARAAIAPVRSGLGSSDAVLSHCLDNFRQIASASSSTGLPMPVEPERLGRLEAWTRAEHSRLASLFDARRAAGFVRECHGDLHLANIVLIDGVATPFDAIEFSPALRWTDVAADVAFAVMDLRRFDQPALARRLLNAWLEETGDFEALRLIPFLLVYRALVRAKVASLRAAQSTDASQQEACRRETLACVVLAEACSTPAPPALLATFGCSGSGKSTLASRLAEHGDWIRLRSDVERKRIAGMAATQRSGSSHGNGIYSDDATRQTYARLATLAGVVLGAGYPVIVDAACLMREQRALLKAVAAEFRVPYAILEVRAAAEVLRTRVSDRAALGQDPSEATAEVLERQLSQLEPLSTAESAWAITVDTGGAVDIGVLAEAISARARVPG